MTAQEVIETIAALPEEDWVTIQSGIADLMASRFSPSEVMEIKEALAEAEAEFERGEGLSSEDVRRQLGLL